LCAGNPAEHERAQDRDRVRRGPMEMPGDLACRMPRQSPAPSAPASSAMRMPSPALKAEPAEIG